MTKQQFFDNQSRNWKYLADNSIQFKKVGMEYANGDIDLTGEVKLISATPARSSAFINDHQVFLVDKDTPAEKPYSEALDLIGDIAENFLDGSEGTLSLYVYDDEGYSNLYEGRIVAIETEDSSEERSLEPTQAIICVSDWELVSTKSPEKELPKVADPSCGCKKPCACDKNRKRTDFDVFVDYLRHIREEAYTAGMKKDGCYSTTFTQTTDADGKTTVTHSINGGKEETNVFDKDGTLIDSTSDCDEEAEEN